MHSQYPSGLLLETRTIIQGFTIQQMNAKEAAQRRITIPYKTCVTLLEYVRDFRDPREESVSLLWDNKIVFVTEIDFEHHFKILA